MRLVRQAKLYFQEGNSDKVYEVDLCEAGEGEFVVNFRYGRRGARLTDGTKTPFPEPLEKAESIFEQLVASKTRKGYREGEAPEKVEVQVEAGIPAPGGGTDRQRAAVKAHLARAAAGELPKNWKLSRLIWRAGELGLSDAIPSLITLAGRDEMSDYALAWTLGRCQAAEAVPVLRQLRASSSPKVVRMAEEALVQCLEAGEREAFLTEVRQGLPASIWERLTARDEEALHLEVARILELREPAPDFLSRLYLVGAEDAMAREAVHEAAGNLPLSPPYFRPLRHLFKAAEFRLDAEVYGLLAHRFERTREFYVRGWGSFYDSETGKWGSYDEELSKPNPRFAYSNRTRAYLRRHVIRTLDRAGELQDTATFITLATGVILAYDDESDQGRPTQDTSYHWDWETRQGNTTVTHYDEFADCLILNHLLYGNSTRYEWVRGAPRWRCVGSYEPGQEAPSEREEKYPRLWDQAPDAIMHLLRQSKVGRVHEFAVKVWRANPGFADLVDFEFLLALLARPYPCTQELGLELAAQCFDPENPDRDLILAVLGCNLDEGHKLGLGWIQEAPSLVRGNAEFATALMLIPHSDVHVAIRAVLSSSPLSEDVQTELVPRVVAALAEFPDSEPASQIVRQVRETLVLIAPEKLGEVSLTIVRDLISHPLDEVQALGGEILSQRRGPADELPDDLLFALLASDSETVRKVGMQLFGKLSDAALLARSDLVASFCISEKPDVREAVRPILDRLAPSHPDFAWELVERFYPMLLRQEEVDGMHEDVYALLEGPLRSHLRVIPAPSCFRMMESKYSAGQRLGFLLLQDFIDLSQVSMRDLVALANTETQLVRSYIWDYLKANLGRVKAEKGEAVRLLDSSWDDTREFALVLFRDQFSEEDWDPETLVSLCDSVRGEVQDFGKEMITRFFQEEQGPTYLLCLSQHPSPELQTFASNYLDRFASGNPERIQALEWYFLSILSQVNRGRVAKARVLRFLEREALESEPVARFAAGILSRQSATVAVQSKAAILAALVRIRKKWPEVSVPFESKPVPLASSN